MREKRDLKFDVRGSKFRKPRTFARLARPACHAFLASSVSLARPASLARLSCGLVLSAPEPFGPALSKWIRMVEQPTSIDIMSLVKHHGVTLAVDDVSLLVQRGGLFSLLGPSGAGKTSVLCMIAGFETLDEETIRIDGRQFFDRNIRPLHAPYRVSESGSLLRRKFCPGN
jgi:ABC-type multidrug transport system fused ATPase/permease subunit